MISANDIAQREPDRQRIAADMAAWEAKHGPVETMPPGQYDRSGITERLTERTKDGWDNRMSEARKKMIAERNGK
jgi:hypothetical protein